MASIIGSLFRGSSLLGAARSLITSGTNSRIGDVVIDASINEVIQYSSSITEHPIEDKTALSDHIFKQPLTVKIEGHITDTPIKIMGLFETPLQKNSLSSLISNIKTALPFHETDKPSQQAYLALKALYTDRCLISVVTKLETFSDMAISSLNFTNDTDTGGRLSFAAELVQVVYSRVETTPNVHVKNTTLARMTSPTSDKGNVDKQPVTKEKALTAYIADGGVKAKELGIKSGQYIAKALGR